MLHIIKTRLAVSRYEKEVPFFKERYIKRVPFLPKMVFKRGKELDLGAEPSKLRDLIHI